jgi:BirA family biotin operon repressor/biotin-[acetyl-CoA-carboxylase] ligase
MKPAATWHLDTAYIGRRVLVFDRLDSTSSQAAALANDPANDGLVILADEQTAGRGQHGRSWTCPTGTGVLLSVLIFPPPELRRPAVLTAWAAVAVCETIRRLTGLPARIKWPNDVLLQGRKVCGILIETRNVEGRIAVTAGIGLNVNQTKEHLAELPEATSLMLMAGQGFDHRETARELIRQLDADYDRLRQGDGATLESNWRDRLGLLGETVTAECVGASHRGRLTAMAWNGLELLTTDGRTLRLLPEAVRHLRPA